MTRTRLLFVSAVFLAAFLLFLVEPIVAKQLLPVLGGSAAVWITCLVFFQTALLCAYAYAHWLTRHPRWIGHLILLVAAFAFSGFWAFGAIDLSRSSEHPVATIFLALSLWIGLPFVTLGATSPLLQFWWSRVEGEGIPYRLFALSNLASLLALGLYPTVVEPYFTLHTQRAAWFIGFLLFVLLATILTLRSRAATQSSAPSQPAESASLPASPITHKLLWLLLPMGASMQLTTVTSYLTANIAPIPLLWILPLAVYLLTIIVAFEFPRLLPRSIVARLLAVMLAGLGYMLSQVDVSLPLRIGVLFSSLNSSSPASFATAKRMPFVRGEPRSPRSSISCLPPAARSDPSWRPSSFHSCFPLTTISPLPSLSRHCLPWPAGGAAAGRCACSGPSPAS